MSMTTYTTHLLAQKGHALQTPRTARRPTAAPRPGYRPDFAALLRRFAPITLSEMSEVALQDRTDTKFVLREGQLYNALATLTQQYRVLDIRGVRLNQYRTLYFDTADFALFQQHHTGRRDRYKVRTRSYVDSHLSFLEVKHKVRQNRTVKSRIATPTLLTEVTPEADAFLDGYLPFAPGALEPKLWNEYTRITLVSKHDCERLTLDLRLRFTGYEDSFAAGRSLDLPGLAIAEVKQDGQNRGSAFGSRLRELGARPTGFSKYCAGVAMLFDEVRHNNFKPKMRLVQKLIQGAYHD
jgi:hypothetical protein